MERIWNVRNGWKADIDRSSRMAELLAMLRLTFSFVLACAACGPVEQPKSAKTIAAYEVPLPTASDRGRFIALLSQKAKAAGFHVDAATDE